VIVAWHRAREPLAVLAAVLIVALTSQRWAGLDTPDSSFYASLSLFGDDVSDRAPENSYYWTRLGYIVPVRLLTTALGPWGGFFVWRLLLIAMLVASVYVIARRFTGIPSAAFLACIASLSSVMLSYLGNTYLTGSVLAGTAALIACALFDSRKAAAVAGLVLGWLVMVNPPGVLLAGTMWLTLRLHATVRAKSFRGSLAGLALAAGVTVLTFGAFLAAGKAVFPQLDWFRAYLDSNARLDYSDYASADAVWLHDISLIVPVAALLTVVVAWATHRREAAAQLALIISLTSIAFMLVFNPLMGGIPLEGPMYQAMLWPPAMIALVLVTTLALPDRRWTRLQTAAGLLAVVLVIATGFTSPALPLWAGWLIAAAAVAVFLLAGYKGTIGAIAGLALLLGCAQLIQNSRGDLGLYYLSPYHWAFSSNPISDRLHTAVNTEEWLLAHTQKTDQILSWVDGDWVGGDRELFVVAGMQLWGENRVGLGGTLDDADIARMNQIRPSVLALYGQSMDAVLQYWKSIPTANNATAPECYDFDWAPNPASRFAVTQGHACLTRLTWSR
jgi:hypothetical protein